MRDALESAVRQFLATYAHADLLEAVIDTSVQGPCLNLWAWRLLGDARLEDAMRASTDTGDWGCLFDVVDEIDSSTFQLRLAAFYPDWPGAIDRGDADVIGILQAAATGLPASTMLIFHHVDAWPAVTIPTAGHAPGGAPA